LVIGPPSSFREVVERGYGRLDHWKILSDCLCSQLIPSFRDLIRTLAAVENAFYVSLRKDSAESRNDALIINARINESVNTLCDALFGMFLFCFASHFVGGNVKTTWSKIISEKDAIVSLKNLLPPKGVSIVGINS
jgi:hypothetical protein